MTIAERNNKLKHFITCLKCEVSGKPCDVNCPTQYEAGNMEEIIENLETISKALSQETSGDAISRQAVLDAIENEYKGRANELLAREIVNIMAIIDDVPPVNSTKTGHWIKPYGGNWHCDKCDHEQGRKSNYCPNCGCRMVEPQERNDKE